MKKTLQLLLITIVSLLSANLFAQTGFNVSGTVTNEKGEPLKSATVFIGGSERVMPTDDNGRFSFLKVPQGTFQLSVQMVGFEPLTRNIIVQNAPLDIKMQLKVKINRLNEVVIGTADDWAKNFKIFKDNFLGRSDNAKQCIILNPKGINFSTTKGLLLADADELLTIENKRLGYRIHYLLKDFGYSAKDNIALYHGEYSFEQLTGTDDEKKQWAKNRSETYQGSFMQFLRAVYANNTLENGFITRPVYGNPTWLSAKNAAIATMQEEDRVIVNDRQVMLDSMVTPIDTNLISLKFKQLYIIYDPRRAPAFQNKRPDRQTVITIESKASVVRLAAKEALIDKKGSFTDPSAFFIQGNWAKARVGDQLPVEYIPPVPDMPRKAMPTNALHASLQRWVDSIPQEKAYLHTDKPYYAPGDTIWFKAYLTSGSRHELSALSGALYVDLIDDKDKAITTLKLPVDSGTVAGDLALGDDVKAGSYRVRAYTQWMRNAGDDLFYDRAITIGKTNASQNTPAVQAAAKPAAPQPDVQFFPESGHLVNNITSRVGFKAVAPDGAGVAVSGTVTDNDNNTVAQINTLHAGMGNFLLRPLPGKTYTANIKFADSTANKIVLPAALNEGYVISVYQPNKDSVLLRVQASANLMNSTIELIAHSSGELVFTSKVDIKSALTSVWLAKRSFPSGIAQFTLFNANHEPLNERIAFISTSDHLQLAIKTDKAMYKSKEHVQLKLNANDSGDKPTAGNFSVAVIDQNKVPIDESAESTIFSNILLTSDIKGYIEKPNYYFMADTGDVAKALDNLMLTQGYRRFEWKLLDNIANAKPTFGTEGRGTSISGTVTSLTHEVLPNANVILLSTNARISKVTSTNANGRFSFDNLIFADSAKFAVQARTVDNKDKAIITIDTIPLVPISHKQTQEAEVNIIKTHLQKAEQEGKPAQLNGLNTLKQVDINATTKKNTDTKFIPQGMFSITDASADKVITIPDPEHYNTLTMFLQSNLQGITIQTDDNGFKTLVDMRPTKDLLNTSDGTDKNAGKEIGLILNGRKIYNKSEVDEILEGSILPSDIAKIEVVRTNTAALNFLRGGNEQYVGYVILITKPTTSRRQYNPAISNIMPKGFNRIRKFYSPRYDSADDAAKIPDPRTTIYWNPYLKTDANGKTTFDLFNADGSGTYRVVVEGINAAGELGRQVYTYKLE